MDGIKKTYCCTKCNKSFVKEGFFHRHLCKVRNSEVQTRSVDKYRCPICGNTSISNFEKFGEHVFQFHDVNLQMHFFKFQLQSQFVAWKRKIEEQTISSYVKESMIFKKNIFIENKPCITKKVGVIKYKCHRSGYFRILKDESERKRRFKAQRSVKINAYCPAKMSAVFRRNGSVKVVFCATHVGHECEVTRLRLTEDERREITSKIAAEIPFDVILDEIKNTAGNSLSRKHFLCKKDLQTIKQSLLRKDNLSVKALIHLQNGQSNVEFVTNDESPEPDVIEEFDDSEIQTFDPNDPDSDSDMLSANEGIETAKSHSEDDVVGCSSKSKCKELLNNKFDPFCSKLNGRNKLSVDKLTVSRRQSQLIDQFQTNVSKLESLNDLKWVENYINRMFIVLKSMKDRRKIKKKNSYPKPNGKSVMHRPTSDFNKTAHLPTRKSHPASQKARSKQFLSVSSPQPSKTQSDFQQGLVKSQHVLKSVKRKRACHSIQGEGNKKVDLNTLSDTSIQSTCSDQMKQYLVPIAGKPDRFLIVQAKANEPPPIGPLTPVNLSKNKHINKSVVVTDHNYSSLN